MPSTASVRSHPTISVSRVAEVAASRAELHIARSSCFAIVVVDRDDQQHQRLLGSIGALTFPEQHVVEQELADAVAAAGGRSRLNPTSPRPGRPFSPVMRRGCGLYCHGCAATAWDAAIGDGAAKTRTSMRGLRSPERLSRMACPTLSPITRSISGAIAPASDVSNAPTTCPCWCQPTTSVSRRTLRKASNNLDAAFGSNRRGDSFGSPRSMSSSANGRPARSARCRSSLKKYRKAA